jgi:hypothetical protein
VGLGITLLGVDKVGELCGVTDKEDGGIVEDLRRGGWVIRSGDVEDGERKRTQSMFPSSVRILMAKPRGSRAVSAEPDSPPTVEKRIVVRALVPTYMQCE